MFIQAEQSSKYDARYYTKQAYLKIQEEKNKMENTSATWDNSVQDVFMPTSREEAEAKRLIRGRYLEAIAWYMSEAQTPYLIEVGKVVDDLGDKMIREGIITDYEVEMLKADSQGYHIDMVVRPPGQYWNDMYFTLLVKDPHKIHDAAFARAMKGV